MVQGGVVNPTNSDEFIENILKYIREKPDLVKELETLLKAEELLKEGETLNESAISKLLIEKKDLFEGVVSIVKEYIEKDDNQLKILLKQVNKVKGMEKELETLGNQLLAQGLISGAAVTALTGALAGLLTVGGVTGALIVGGAAFLGFMALVAIAAIGYAIYQHRGEIKEGAIDSGKAVKSLVKDLIDKLPTIQDRDKNFYKLLQELSQLLLQSGKEGSEIKNIQDKAQIIEMLRNEGQQSAIQELVKNGTIQNFSEADMIRLLEKGLSTHEEDMQKLLDLMKDFLPAIMASGNNEIEKVEEIVNKKVEEMKPYSQVENVSLKQGKEGKGKG
ncbi:glycine zipper family protein [Wolbachia endosymbiont of Kerria lacca]|uniref:glycine zipper family protein n=1 Tax=Wolbachia endosymbiont of Kerria lacca TaxID=427705 RepID=UPI003F677229